MAAKELMYGPALVAMRAEPGVLVIDFYKDDCGPCNLLAPVIDGFADEFAGRVTVVKVNVEQHPGLAAQFNVQAFPTVFILKNGEIKHFFAGRKPAAVIRQMIEELL